MRTETKAEVTESSRSCTSSHRHALNAVFLCVGDMVHLDAYMQERSFVLQLAVWILRGVSQVILANNPLSGVLILAALFWESPWQCLLGVLGTLVSTLIAVIIGLDRTEVSDGVHGFNGMLVALLIGLFNSAGDWYWRLLLPVCFASATSVFMYNGLSSFLITWGLPVSVFPFNITILLYLLCMGPDNPYFPNYQIEPPGFPDSNDTHVNAVQLMRSIPLGVGQIYGCKELGPSLLIEGAVALYSPLLALYAVLGSAFGSLASLSVAVRHEYLYSGLMGFNGALGSMGVAGEFILTWRTHIFAVFCALLSTYGDIALGNLLGTVGLPASSWASTTSVTLMLLMTGTLSKYRVPSDKVRAPEYNLSHRKRTTVETTEIDMPA